MFFVVWSNDSFNFPLEWIYIVIVVTPAMPNKLTSPRTLWPIDFAHLRHFAYHCFFCLYYLSMLYLSRGFFKSWISFNVLICSCVGLVDWLWEANISWTKWLMCVARLWVKNKNVQVSCMNAMWHGRLGWLGMIGAMSLLNIMNFFHLVEDCRYWPLKQWEQNKVLYYNG